MKRAVSYVHKKNAVFPVEKRIEVVTKVMALGNMRLVADLTGVSYGRIRQWKLEPWWKQLEIEIKASRNAQVDTKLNKIIDKALDTIEDRLDNGDFVYDQKRGEISRKPVSLKEARGAANDLMQRQVAIAKLANEEQHLQTNTTIKEQLADLALQFAAFNTKRTIDVVAAPEDIHAVHEERKTGLQERERSLQQSPGTSESQNGAQSSASGNGESWESSQGGREGHRSQAASLEGWDEFDDELESSDEDTEQELFEESEWESKESTE